jgi:thiol-disulfide isomerase/thioredoxin
MLARYEPSVKATISFLRLLEVKVNNASVNETLQNHPDWPSLLCISDSLQKWNIPNAAGRIRKEDIENLPLPFMACTTNMENPIALVTQLTQTHIHYYSQEKGKSIVIEKEVFLKRWDGVYLIAEATKESGEKNYDVVKRKLLFQSLIPFMLLFLLTAFSFYALQTVFDGKVSATVYIHYCIYIAGIIVTSLLLLYEMDRNNPLLKKVCTGLSKGSCEAILTGAQAKLLSWLSWSEIGFFYFTGSLLALLFVPSSSHVLAWISLLATPYIIFSLYYQWRVAKKWCVLCLAVQSLLLMGGLNTLAGSFLLPFVFSVNILLKTGGCFILPILCWYSVKPYCHQLQQSIATKREYLRIKFNPQVFDALLKKQKAITISVDHLGIDLGKKGAPNSLVKVCNPYCGPCARAHSKIEKLLEEHSNLSVKIIFVQPSNQNDLLSKPTKHLMAITAKQNEQLTKKALDDWYLTEKKDYGVFANKYSMNGELLGQDHKLNAMGDWCREMEIVATPTFFWNGYQLPDAYGIEDLEYFLLE